MRARASGRRSFSLLTSKYVPCVGAPVVAVARLVDADPVAVGLVEAEADLRVRVVRAAVVVVEAGRVDLRLDGEVALGQRLAEEGDRPGLGLVDRARAEREARGCRPRSAGRARRWPASSGAGSSSATCRARRRTSPSASGTCRRSRPGRRPPSRAWTRNQSNVAVPPPLQPRKAARPTRSGAVERRRVARLADQRPGRRPRRARTRRSPWSRRSGRAAARGRAAGRRAPA